MVLDLFVKFHLLKPGNRVAFSKADLSILTAIDIEKGKDEIPLIRSGYSSNIIWH